MKKRFFVSMILVLILAACIGALVACDGKDGTTDTDKTPDALVTVDVESVTLDKTSLALETGDEATITAVVKPDNATDKSVSWTVSPNDDSVITFNNGKIVAVAPGTATVTASASGKNASCTVTVAPVRTEVTESEWNAAFACEKNSVTLSAYYSDTDFVNIFKADKINQRFYIQSSEISINDPTRYFEYFYVVVEGNEYYRYNSSDSVYWERFVIDENIYKDTTEEYLISTEEIAQAVSGKYSDFVYSDGSYVADNIETEILGTVERIVVFFEKGELKKIVLTPDESIAREMVVDFGEIDMEIPSDYTQIPINVVGKYYRIVKSPQGWVVDDTTYFKFNSDYSFCWQIYAGRIENGIKYGVDDNVISMTISSLIGEFTAYAVIDGNILWNFDEIITDIEDLSNSNTFFYSSNEISDADLKKIIEIKGDGIATNGG